jgi:hypothetical protein
MIALLQNALLGLKYKIINTLRNVFRELYPVYSKKSDKILNSIPVTRSHTHHELVRRNEPAPKTTKLQGTSNYAPATHKHTNLVPKLQTFTSPKGTTIVVEDAETLESQSSLAFAKKNHTHLLEPKSLIPGFSGTVASAAQYYSLDGSNLQLVRPEQYFAPKGHTHSIRYYKKQQAVKFARKLKLGPFFYSVDDNTNAVQLALAEHEHPEYELASLCKLKTTSVQNSDVLATNRLIIIRERYEPDSIRISSMQTIGFRLNFLLPERYWSRNMVPETNSTIKNVAVQFSLYAPDAFASYKNKATSSDAFESVKLRQYYPSLFLTALQALIGPNNIGNKVAVVVSIPISKYSFAYFVQKKIIPSPVNKTPEAVFCSPMAYSTSRTIDSIARDFNDAYFTTLAMLRTYTGTKEDAPLGKPVNSLFAFGLAGKSPEYIKLYTGGFFATALVFYKTDTQ